MIELLAIVAIVAILILALMLFLRNQNSRGYDARRKADLEMIETAFEDYFNDNGCYPDPDILNICGDKSFQPYLESIPCDPVSGKPYAYEPVDDCGGYRAYAILQDSKDPSIRKLGCDGPEGCGADSGVEYNYGISVGVPLYGGGSILSYPSPSTGTSTSPSPMFVYACESSGICNQFQSGHPILISCPIIFQESNCQNSCASLANRCK